MATENVWQQAVDLTNRVFQVTSDLNLPRGNHWPVYMVVSLHQANERLYSVRVLLDNGCWYSAAILARSLFELAANVAYIAKDAKDRLPRYLKHGGIPLSEEEAQQLQQKIEQGYRQEIKDFVPGQAWKPLKEICCDLGADWLKEYETFYRYVSVPTHAGSFTLGQNYIRLFTQPPPSDQEKATVLITALDFHLRVAGVAAVVFPVQIKHDTVTAMRLDCQKLGQLLAKGLV